jgi:hypothetical protein
MRIPPIAVVTMLLAACSGGGATDGNVGPGIVVRGKCLGELATLGQECPATFDGTEASLPACTHPGFGNVSVWACQDLFILMQSDGYGGAVCYYDTTSHALVGAEWHSDIGVYCNQTSLSIEAGRTNPMCRENAPTIVKHCRADGGTSS